MPVPGEPGVVKGSQSGQWSQSWRSGVQACLVDGQDGIGIGIGIGGDHRTDEHACWRGMPRGPEDGRVQARRGLAGGCDGDPAANRKPAIVRGGEGGAGAAGQPIGFGSVRGAQILVGDEVADPGAAARPQDPQGLNQHARLVGGQVDDAA